MGNDSALACLSDQPRMLYDYFKQLFAQVTNPAIDSIREEIIMSLECYIGPESNLLETTDSTAIACSFRIRSLTNEELAALKHIDHRGWKAKNNRHHLAAQRGQGGCWSKRSTAICAEAEAAIDEGCVASFVSDREHEPRPGAGQRAARLRRGASSSGAANQTNPHRHRD